MQIVTNEQHKSVSDSVTLPDWILPHLPEVRPPASVSYDGGYVITYPNGDTIRREGTGYEAYRFLREQGESVEVLSHGPDLGRSGFNKILFTVAEEGSGESYLLLNHTDKDSLRALKISYYAAQRCIERYRENPGSFWSSYDLVATHPAFWTRESDQPTFHWNTATHAEELLLTPMRGEASEVRWDIETGPHIPPDYTSRYLDYRLTVSAPSVEEAYVQLAAQIVKLFNDDGSEKHADEPVAVSS